MRLLLTRPREDSQATAARLSALGHRVVEAPLLAIRRRADPPDLSGVQAVLITSRNGLAAFAAATRRRDLPVLAVGPASAEAARAAGFRDVASAEGDVAALARLVIERQRPEAGLLYHPAGSRTAGDLAGKLAEKGFRLRRAVLYDAQAVQELPEAARTALAAGDLDGVLFFSPRTARIFVNLVERAHLANTCRPLIALCLSPAVAKAAEGLTWRAVRTAEMPEQSALLALLERHEQETP